ncbi:type IV secretion system protein TraC [Piscirickettsia salmonis]|nr:type IV secretion system protein TraC [Piscirickettsia salmonis]ALA26639.1 conjugal transfer protein TraC [Piscirickettsia salmonis]APS45852.1 conjugal transfer protein TraC [Piscirickettsia salmonis]APS49265.1 conjugal transfer protein TraC [Piscirickettsia salmonis]QGO82348.1 conjugal transfer ATP-binding protein TraC [Piscirickettsia salmonis]QGP24177.1 conjugal transfer ATP-binding protein TraC [Piscirickettsia salmonis]
MLSSVKESCRKALNYMGLAEEKAESSRIPATMDRSEYEHPSFAEQLTYKYYDEKSQIFFNEKNAGLIYRISPLTGANEKVAEQLDSILRTKISDNLTMMALKITHNQVAPKIDRFAKQFKNDEFKNLSKLGDSLEQYYKSAATSGFKTRDESRGRLTQTEVYVVVDMASGQKTEAELRVLFDRFKVSFQAALTASNIGFQVCDAMDFIHITSFFTRHNTQSIYPRTVDYNDDELLKYQLNDRSFSLEVDSEFKDHLILSGDDQIVRSADKTERESFETEISVLTLDKMPTSYQLWNNINNCSNIFNSEYGIHCNHIVSVIYKIDDHGKALGKAGRKTRDLTKKAKSDFATLVPGTEEGAQQWKSFYNDLSKQTTRSCRMLYNVILFSEKGRRHEDVEAAINTHNFNGLKLSVCKHMQMPYFLASMPFMFTGNLQYDFSLPTMMHHISSWNATQYLPLLSDWQGQDKGIMLPSMRSQIALIDPFSGYFGTNFNASVTGTSGAGKSFLMQMMALSTLFDGGYVYIIDIGGSYRKLCDAVGGVYLEYKNLAMNPFTYISNIDDSIDDLIDLFELLACPKKGATDLDSSALRTAILKAYEKCADKTLIDDVQNALNEIYNPERYPTARALASNIAKYCSNAEHGAAFNNPSKLDPKSRFIVVDLQEIKDKKNVVAPALLSVFSQFRKRIYDSDRAVKKLCLVDEAWTFFEGDPRAIEFLVIGFRTGRRHNASFVTITQGVNDYFNFPAAEQLWDNASLKFVLLQDETTLTKFNKERELFSEYEMEVLKKFPKAKEAGYSQVMMRGSNINTFQRLFVDPFTLVMLSSDGKDYSAVQELLEQKVPFMEAVERVARRHYGEMYVSA